MKTNDINGGTTMTTTIRCTFIKQGGYEANGVIIGPQGTPAKGKLLISYRIDDGQNRERWIPRKRVLEIANPELLTELPRWKTIKTPGVAFTVAWTWDGALVSGTYGYNNRAQSNGVCKALYATADKLDIVCEHCGTNLPGRVYDWRNDNKGMAIAPDGSEVRVTKNITIGREGHACLVAPVS